LVVEEGYTPAEVYSGFAGAAETPYFGSYGR
jgi:hypothetical protein